MILLIISTSIIILALSLAKQDQVDYLNGYIQYKAVPTTQINYEPIQPNTTK